MSICYLCGENLVNKPADYAANPIKYKSLAVRHVEHIIQNSLYGRLTDNNILCEACGGKLSVEVDANFIKIFHSITEQLKPVLASRDHGGNNYFRTLDGQLFKEDGSVIEVQIRNGKVVPNKPDYEYLIKENLVRLYCPKKVAKSFKVYVEGQLKAKGIDIGKVEFEVVEDISHLGDLGIFFSEGIEDFNSKFMLGLNKIAVGYAVANGINRIDLPCSLDVSSHKIIFTSNVVPFYPHSTLDYIIESFRVAVEDHYPTHTLILFTDDFSEQKKLVCYIDLFSTFQFYVILNHDYAGKNIRNCYYQTIVKQEKPQINVRGVRMKFLNILAQDIGVSMEELRGKSIDEMYSYLEMKYNQMTVSYEMDLKSYVGYVVNKVSMNLLLKKSGHISHLSDLEKQIIDSMPELDIDEIAVLHHELKRIEDNGVEDYRQSFLEVVDKENLILRSTLFKMIELNNADPDIFKSYGHLKFYQLYNFIRLNKSTS